MDEGGGGNESEESVSPGETVLGNIPLVMVHTEEGGGWSLAVMNHHCPCESTWMGVTQGYSSV